MLLNLDGQIALADFGLLEQLPRGKDAQIFRMAGTAYFMAPETILLKSAGFGVDIWALGCLAFELASGETPNHEFGRMKVK